KSSAVAARACCKGRPPCVPNYNSTAPVDARIGVAAQDLFGDEVLQSPEIAVADAVLLELGNRVEQVFGARPGMSAGAGENCGDPRMVLLLHPERALEASPED